MCLSLLGTWSGRHDEKWTEDSTLWQVLVSIQSAILGAEFPYFNEPGYEAQWGTAVGHRNARIAENGGYERLRVATIQHAMTCHLRQAPLGFEDFVTHHFWIKRWYILGIIDGWIEEAATKSDTKGHLLSLLRAKVGFLQRLVVVGKRVEGGTCKRDEESSVQGVEENSDGVGAADQHHQQQTAVEEIRECLRSASLKEELCCLLRLPHGYRMEPPVFRWNNHGPGAVAMHVAHSPWARPRQSIPLPPPPPGVEPVPCNKHSDYAMYFKLLDMGCPMDAVKLKMTLEGWLTHAPSRFAFM